jgi:hypothetical protein
MKRAIINLSAVATICGFVSWASPALAQTAPALGDAAPFAVLAGTTVTNTGSSVIAGNVGVSPNNAIVGFPPGVITAGSVFHAGTATAAAAQASLTTAYNNLEGQASTGNLTGQDLGGKTLTSGVYTFSSSAQLTGALALDAQGDPNAVFIFQIATTLTTASNSSVEIINGGSPCNVFWQVGSSATLGTTTDFAGNILALASITLNTGATIAGRALARSGAVTLDTNTTSAAICGGPPAGGCPVIGITPVTLPNGQVGVPYSARIFGNSGLAPYVYTITSGTLPAGLVLSTAGRLTGTPTSPLAQTFLVRVTDATACFAEITYTFLFGASVPTLPEVVFIILAVALLAVGFFRLRRPPDPSTG